MAYYTTADLAHRHGLSPAAALYYLKQSGITPERTAYRHPRHCLVLSWPEPAARWLHNRLMSRPIMPAPDPMRWLPLSVARARLGISRQRLAQLTQAGRIRTRRVLIKTKNGARWHSFALLKDVELYPKSRIFKNRIHTDMASHLPLLLVRAWLALLDLESSQGTPCLAAYTKDAAFVHLMTGNGQLHMLPTSCPESCPTLPAPTDTPPADLDQWHTATEAMRQAVQQLHASQFPLILSIAADSVTLWRKVPGYPSIAEYPLPTPAAEA